MTQPLTALERELLASVERLVTACESSATELHALEKRSTSRIEKELTGLKGCATLLIRSQAASMRALQGLLNDETNYKTLDENLAQSLNLAKAAAERLRDS